MGGVNLCEDLWERKERKGFARQRIKAELAMRVMRTNETGTSEEDWVATRDPDPSRASSSLWEWCVMKTRLKQEFAPKEWPFNRGML